VLKVSSPSQVHPPSVPLRCEDSYGKQVLVFVCKDNNKEVQLKTREMHFSLQIADHQHS
jgi:hypothetical protein